MTCIETCFKQKRAAGKPINAQAKAICINECKNQETRQADYDYFQPFPVTYITVPYLRTDQ